MTIFITNVRNSKENLAVLFDLCLCVFIAQRHSKSRLACQIVEKEEDDQERSGREAGGQFNR